MFSWTIKGKKGKIHTAEMPMVRAIITNKFGPALSSFPHRHNPFLSSFKDISRWIVAISSHRLY